MIGQRRAILAPGIGLLVVVEEKVDQAEQGLEVPPGSKPGCLQAAVEALLLGRLEQGRGEVELEHRLAAGERQAAAGRSVESAIFQHLPKHLGYGKVSAGHFQCVAHAGTGASPAQSASLALQDVDHPVARRLQPVDAVRTSGNAIPATDALLRRER